MKDDTNKMYISFSNDGGITYYNANNERVASRWNGIDAELLSPGGRRRDLLEGEDIVAMKHRRLECNNCVSVTSTTCASSNMIVPISNPELQLLQAKSNCDSDIANILKAGADAGLAAGLWYYAAAPGPGTIAAVAVVVLKLSLDLYCAQGGTRVPALLAADVTSISLEVARGAVLDGYIAEFNELNNNIRIQYTEHEGIPSPKLIEYVEKANYIEAGVASQGIVGIHTATTAAALKFQLLLALKDASRTVETPNVPCCTESSTYFNNYLVSSKDNFKLMRDDFNNYKTSRQYTPYEDSGCSGCPCCCFPFFCCSLYRGQYKARNNQNIALGSCYSDPNEYRYKSDMARRMNEWFDRLEGELWTSEVRALEHRVNFLAGKNWPVECTPYQDRPVGPLRNVARGKPARQSSTYNSYKTEAATAVDGDFIWETRTATGPYDPVRWWEVSLGKSYIIEQIKLHQTFTQDSQVRIYKNGELVWIPVAPIKNAHPREPAVYNFSGVEGDRVRIQKTGHGSSLMIKEVEIFSRDVG